MANTDVLVLGAGIVGVSAAIHLQRRGRQVVLLDRRGAGEETSYGNAGLIERASVFPYGFPRALGTLLRYAGNGATDAHYHLSALPQVLPWLVRYAMNSSPEAIARTAAAAWPLIQRCLVEHEALMAEAGAAPLLRKVGWIKAFRTAESLAKGLVEREKLRPYGLTVDVLDGAGLAEQEPFLAEGLAGGLHFRDPAAVSDPGALVQAYAALLVRLGGRFVRGDALSLNQDAAGWRVATEGSAIVAREVVVALGPWSNSLTDRFGYPVPLGVKRGYHQHFRARGNAVLNRPVLDVDGGYLLAPMAQGIRLTTGAEFARRDAPPTPVQVARALPKARRLFPLGDAVEARPWMGSRPCLPDMLPVIDKGARHKGLWFDFGHQHHGLTLGPVTGRLLAEMMTGEPTFTDPTPYRIDRF
ncbi:FAD-binding oxidoreductase [Lichenihabitans sp. Uapishka_5]|uniref:NAD(P)/FAD-dependent oxidoreductase n=1 Tax=Lichenihabitans sp. Uapishka_5 TaxID=3037302 RepID=UPI0029E829CE|nr:FAD-binding oxidoreductase [Lichenihabitans sp. Uapishka_5]MDX7949596.1 FAD-binding oxidoreductase [Lichenihabitans sp. Uapishka_5]